MRYSYLVARLFYHTTSISGRTRSFEQQNNYASERISDYETYNVEN